MSRQGRNSEHRKQNRMQIQRGVPSIGELQEGVPVLRLVGGIGVVQYIKCNGELYSSAFSRFDAPKSASNIKISKLTSGLSGLLNGEIFGEQSIDHYPAGLNNFAPSVKTVTQGTSATTAVTLHSPIGQINTYAAALAANNEVEFTVNNNYIRDNSIILITMEDNNTTANGHYLATINSIARTEDQTVAQHDSAPVGSFKINLFNCGYSATSATSCTIHFIILDAFCETLELKIYDIIQALRMANIIGRDGKFKEDNQK